MLSNERKVINSGDGLKNLGIIRELAAVTISQDVPLFEVSKSMFDNDSAASKFCVSSLLEGR